MFGDYITNWNCLGKQFKCKNEINYLNSKYFIPSIAVTKAAAFSPSDHVRKKANNFLTDNFRKVMSSNPYPFSLHQKQILKRFSDYLYSRQ